jgi:excisionase family DNA binding protein
MSATATPLLVTYLEAAEMIGGPRKPVSTRHVERLVAARKLRAVGRGRARRIVYASILAYIESEASRG